MKESKINIRLARGGMKLSRPALDVEGTLLIQKQVELSPKSIMRLKMYGVEEVWIQGELDTKESIFVQEESTYVEKLKKTEGFRRFEQAHKVSVDEVKKALNGLILNNKVIESSRLISEVDHMLREAQTGMQVFDMLQCIKNYDDSTYVHSVNVALICNVMGRWLNLPAKEIEILTLCGILHDIGKLLMPPEIIKKAGKLTKLEYATIKTHPYVGYSLMENEEMDVRIKKAILQHHEKCDGSGYPNHLVANEIEGFSKIVTIADIYDAMTANRVYREGLCPFDVIEVFEQEGLQKYDPLYMMVFLKRIAESYLNKPVRLNDEQVGKVIMINTATLSRPVVKVDRHYIDLSKTKDLAIQAIL